MCKLFIQHQGNSFRVSINLLFSLISISCFVFNHDAVLLTLRVASHTTHTVHLHSRSKQLFQLVCISQGTSLVRTRCPNITSNNPISVDYVQWVLWWEGVKRGHIHIILNIRVWRGETGRYTYTSKLFLEMVLRCTVRSNYQQCTLYILVNMKEQLDDARRFFVLSRACYYPQSIFHTI